MITRRPPPREGDLCVEPHEYGPTVGWFAWARKRAETHDLHACPDCGLDVIWRPRGVVPVDLDHLGLFGAAEG